MGGIVFYDEGTRTAISCLETLKASKVAWIYRAKRLEKIDERILVHHDKDLDMEIYVELTNKKTMDGKKLYRFIKKLYSTTTFTYYSSDFCIEE